jgi:ribonuclease HI
LESVDGKKKLEAADEEEDPDPERLELLAVVRGLEALDQPSQVTLVTRRHSISRGLRFGLANWRENNWQWECYGRMADVKDADLWQRVDRALEYHDVHCRTWRFDPPEDSVSPPRSRGHRPAARNTRVASRASLLSRVGAFLTMPGRRRRQQQV